MKWSELKKDLNRMMNKESYKGFYFVMGNTPLGLEENRPMRISACLKMDPMSSVVVDGNRMDVEKQIIQQIFEHRDNYFTLEQAKKLQEKFTELGYEIEELDHASGYWYYFYPPEVSLNDTEKLILTLKKQLKDIEYERPR